MSDDTFSSASSIQDPGDFSLEHLSALMKDLMKDRPVATMMGLNIYASPYIPENEIFVIPRPVFPPSPRIEPPPLGHDTLYPSYYRFEVIPTHTAYYSIAIDGEPAPEYVIPWYYAVIGWAIIFFILALVASLGAQ